MDDDRLSELPDSLIHAILSLLDMRDVVRTTLLSKQWRNRWTTIPSLRFRFRFPLSPNLWVKSSNFVSGALSQWKGAKILEFTVIFPCFLLSSSSSDIDSWLLFAIEKQVEKLTFGFECKPDGAYLVPQCLYSCSSITKLSLHICSLKIERNVQWNQLKRLEIRNPDGLSGDAMNRILVGAPLLEELVLWSFEIYENFSIRSTSLKTLEIGKKYVGVSSGVNADAELRIWAPNLLSLVFSVCVCGSCLLYVPSLTTASLSSFYVFMALEGMSRAKMLHHVFRSIRYVENVTLPNWSIQFLVDTKKNDMLVQFPNAEFLKLNISDCQMLCVDVLDVLEMFPKLKTLIVDENGYMPIKVASEMISGSPSLLHLETVEINVYESYPSISTFVKFVLENAHVLQKIVLQTNGKECDQEAIILALKKLLGMRRSSTYVKLIINKVTL